MSAALDRDTRRAHQVPALLPEGEDGVTTTRTHISATPMYPGSFFPEDGRPTVIPNAEPATALAAVKGDDGWFCLEVRTVTQKRWADGDGGEMWTDDGQPTTYRIYVGEQFTADQIEQWPDANDHRILLSNMRGNGWASVVRTRRGNFQPVEPGDVVLTATRA